MAVGALLSLTPLAVPTQGGCDPNLAAAGLCGQNTETEIVLEGSKTTPPEPGTTPSQPIDWLAPIEDWWQPLSGEKWISPEQVELTQCIADWDSNRPCFIPPAEGEDPAEAQDEDAGIPPITITDLARFAPDGSIIIGEPDNVGVVGLPTNFVAAASVQTVDGELFGFPVSVRFSPSAFDFAFGDGSTATTTSGGATWEALDQAQFTPTDTSHTYSERGTYTAHVDVRYTAEVDFGIGWLPITGEVTSAGAPQEIRIFEAHTALVAHTCEQAPSSPGC